MFDYVEWNLWVCTVQLFILYWTIFVYSINERKESFNDEHS